MADTSGSERRLRLFIYARIIVYFLFLASTLLLKLQTPFVDTERYQPGIIRLMAFSFFFSLSSLLALKRQKFTPFLTYLQVIWDLLFVTVLLLFTGGILSPYSFLYLLSIMIAGMLLGRRQALYTASLCGILYGAILDFQYFGYLSFIGLTQEDANQVGALRLLYTISFNLIAFGLTAFITGLLAERARLSEEALQRSSIDYSELDQLNSAIVAHSESGLLTTTVSGRIRVFNPYAEAIVGLSQSDAYDKPIVSVFSHLSDLSALLDQKSNSKKREFDYITCSGKMVTLGYRVARFNDSKGSLAGYIVNFRDITHLRRMEAALKKTDRLAALGELSARMAHEIRNPLAALCGSVQLLSSGADIKEHDARLLAIVTREAARLDTLISEFLLYARPAQPQLQKIQLHAYIEEEFVFLAQDQRLAAISLRNHVPKTAEVIADPNQLHQVFINLLQNAADAMPDGGEVKVEQRTSSDTISICITDTGPGIAEEALQHLFEPFWTTKPAGTGLGLAISYRIVEAHGGSISVEKPTGGGCRFVVTLPV
ncbi:MAG: ATP-binding protein [Desulfuromonadaceae bacterium]|nr:ATP-binding protein [Desulfuromonadaceae bacterium]MDD2849354.1 ATP-binding protein [Desulfuromonadaceae bacterium]MDD4129413.1 ATP-binding protein [Desulfuromonadaceae bacterium]